MLEIEIEEQFLTASQRRKLKKNKKRQKENTTQPLSLKLKEIFPKTLNQRTAFNYYSDGKNLLLHGLPGTGKTFISLYLALKEVFDQNSNYNKAHIVRSVVPTRDMGFLPGSMKQKMDVYEAPYQCICNELFGRGDAYELLKQKNTIEFMSTSFIRGITLSDTIVIVDECQNMSSMELHSVMTRLGDNSKILFCGDTRQDDLTSERKKEVSGLKEFMNILINLDEFECLDFHEEDIVRSGLVKSYIIERYRQGI